MAKINKDENIRMAKEYAIKLMKYDDCIYEAMVKFLASKDPEPSKELGESIGLRKHTISRYIMYAARDYMWSVVALRHAGLTDEEAMYFLNITKDIEMHFRIMHYYIKRAKIDQLHGRDRAKFNELTYNQFTYLWKTGVQEKYKRNGHYKPL